MSEKLSKNDEIWREKLTAEEFRICRQKGTEAPFTGEYLDSKTVGSYRCKCCNEVLFSSEAKYDSGSGWPSFYQPISGDAVKELSDGSLGMQRTEIVCDKCDSHLGHVFPDGPQPTGQRYCVNSASLSMAPKEADE